MINLTVNGKKVSVAAADDMPLVVGHPRCPRHDGHEVRMRHRPVRRLHGACRWRAAALLPDPGRGRRRPRHHHHRRHRRDADRQGRAEGVARPRGRAVRLLPVRPDHEAAAIIE